MKPYLLLITFFAVSATASANEDDPFSFSGSYVAPPATQGSLNYPISLNIQESSLTVGELVAIVRREHENRVNIIITPEAAELESPPIQVRNVGTLSLFETLAPICGFVVHSQGAEAKGLQGVVTIYRENPSLVGPAPLKRFPPKAETLPSKVAIPQTIETIESITEGVRLADPLTTKAYSIAGFGGDIDQHYAILKSLIYKTWKKSGFSRIESASVSLNDAAKILIVRAPSEGMAIAETLIVAYKESVAVAQTNPYITQKINEALARIAELTATGRGPNHPSIKVLKTEIKELENALNQ